MQLARNLFLSHERSISRKLKEIELAREIEKRYSKDQILLLYLNTVYFGNGAYGIWAAAREYFQKDPADLSISESAMLVGLLQAPERYNPLKHPDRALQRRNQVLHILMDVGRISKQEYDRLRRSPLGLNPRASLGKHFAEYVRREAEAILSRSGKSLRDGNYRVVTTLDISMQLAAESAVQATWNTLPAGMQEAQIGALCIDPRTGAILCMIGGNPASSGRDLNHVTQIRRQPGSAFKAFLYASLLEQGYTLATPLMDAPLVVDSGMAWEWRPSNVDGGYSGVPVPMKTAIQYSLNLAAAHAIVELSDAMSVADFAHRCGIQSELRAFPSLALGTSEVSPLEMTSAFGVFASGGRRATPFAISRIEDARKRVMYQSTPDTATVLDAATAYLVTEALSAAVDSGTARQVRRLYSGPAAGKTGTTQQHTDAWFVGYTTQYCMAVWAGFDAQTRKLTGAYRYGGTLCAPIWARVMNSTAAKSSAPDSSFVMPVDIVHRRLCLDSGMQADEACPRVAEYPVNMEMLPGVCIDHATDVLFGW